MNDARKQKREQERKPIGQRIAALEERTRAMDLSIHVGNRNLMALKVLIHATVLACGVAPGIVKDRLAEVAASLPPEIRPDIELAEISTWLDEIAAKAD